MHAASAISLHTHTHIYPSIFLVVCVSARACEYLPIYAFSLLLYYVCEYLRIYAFSLLLYCVVHPWHNISVFFKFNI
jgi:hypothetical protein